MGTRKISLRIEQIEVFLMEDAENGESIGYAYEVILGSTTLYRTATVNGVEAWHVGEDACRKALDYSESVARELCLPKPRLEDDGRAERIAGWIDAGAKSS